jgi:hypothetical protein
MKVYSHSEPGNHPTNEDAIAILRRGDDPATLICALAVGQGGRAGAALAAQRAVASCQEQARSQSLPELLNPITSVTIGEEVDQSVRRQPEAGFTTFIGLAVIPSFIVGVSCGDSAVGLLLGEKFVLLSERQYKNPPVGSGGAQFIPFSARLDEPWKLLIMSDGVWKYAGWDRITERSRSDSGQALVSGVRDGAVATTGGHLLDDFSLILIES